MVLTLNTIGTVHSPFKTVRESPKMEHEAGAAEATITLEESYASALEGIVVGRKLLLLTWLHKARRDVLRCYPRGDKTNGLQRGLHDKISSQA